MGFYDYELKGKTWHLIGVMPLSNVSVDEEICSLTDYLNHWVSRETLQILQ